MRFKKKLACPNAVLKNNCFLVHVQSSLLIYVDLLEIRYLIEVYPGKRVFNSIYIQYEYINCKDTTDSYQDIADTKDVVTFAIAGLSLTQAYGNN